MGFSLVGAFAIVGVSIFIAIELFTGSLLPVLAGLDDSYDDLVDRRVELTQTDINITDVSIYINGLNYDHNVTIKNTGSVTLNTSDFTILVNGVPQQFISSDSYLYPKKETHFNVTNLPGDGNKRLKVITEKGISDYYEYII